MRIADTKNIDVSNAYCGIEPARYHAYLRVELRNKFDRVYVLKYVVLDVFERNRLQTSLKDSRQV